MASLQLQLFLSNLNTITRLAHFTTPPLLRQQRTLLVFSCFSSAVHQSNLVSPPIGTVDSLLT